MKLYLVRHPQPQLAQGICYGVSDVVCSPQAIESAAAGLLKQLPRGLKIICSPLSRCEHLAQHLCVREPTFAYKTDEKLAEMNFGAWELQAWQAIAPQELGAWTDAFASYRCGGSGESTAALLQRVAKRLLLSWQSGEDQIWITHAGVIRAVQWLCVQSWEGFTALARHSDPERFLSQIRAADWPAGEIAFGRLHQERPWDWPAGWP